MEEKNTFIDSFYLNFVFLIFKSIFKPCLNIDDVTKNNDVINFFLQSINSYMLNCKCVSFQRNWSNTSKNTKGG